MDVFTRMVTGFYQSMDSPSRRSTSLCLLHSVYAKMAWLKERKIDEPWPVAGFPERIHVDNGMGKTMIMKRFRDQHPPVFDRKTGVLKTPVWP